MTALYLARSQFQLFLDTIIDSGYHLAGPQILNDAIVYDDLSSTTQLPLGVIDVQSPGQYRLQKHSHSSRWFSWVSGPQGLKPWLFKPQEYLWAVQRDSQGKLQFDCSLEKEKSHMPLAIVGLRACDLAALALQDKHFLQGEFKDPYYASRRESMLVIAVNCSRSAETCFCSSTGDGPEVRNGFDILLNELQDGFVVNTGSDLGAKILDIYSFNHARPPEATTQQCDAADAQVQMAASQHRRMPDTSSVTMEQIDLNEPAWQDVVTRCLSCSNCTSVCPTCFCHNERDEPDINGDSIRHYRQWSSCFTREHSYMHGIVIRSDTQLRYRQWFLHKLVSWHQQYGRSGCVGCGRCITWCPVGIDITHLAQHTFNAKDPNTDNRQNPA